MKRDGGESFSPEVNSRSTAAAGDGSSIEQSAKRPRGRPVGSKNKLKPPVIITCDSEPGSALRTHVLEIPGGRDVAECLAAFASGRGICLCVLAGSGPISTATIRQTSPSSAALTFRGRFDLISLSATFLMAGGGGGNMSVSLAGPQGQVIGGVVVGPLVAAGKVMVVAAVFSDPVFHRLPELEAEASGSVSGEEESERSRAAEKKEEEGRSGYAVRGLQTSAKDDDGAARFGGGQFGDDGVWAPATRPPAY
ncbi:AT-hook motif nuclear-localized protein 28 [Dendrobium catenatum]|uniref:AT-hook motif nuclear-localized protein n=1 Tax=Dendrobium catenatum TaxID=906689 RepID=A0A2I0W1F5_9ASPA|nr:AT-hook motif nuclear-localized protein 28 [Dendrobium catenatum]PKU69501.1 Putative DNA-binding protein ESCAROLA [Dendrobium catenatum]